jgi:ribosomal-protein-alanine N-acetyltransferase
MNNSDVVRIKTSRLLLRKPLVTDAKAIFTRYASDVEVTRYMGWPIHKTIEDTLAFIEFSDQEWRKWPAGPYLIELLSDGTVIGSTGLTFESHDRALTGYILAKDSWGCGYATEALQAMVSLSKELNVSYLYGLCHHENIAAKRVMEKCGFLLERDPYEFTEFPNLENGRKAYTLRLSKAVDPGNV